MDTSILTKFGRSVRKQRERQKLTQEQLADLAGLHRTYIGMVERAEKNITLLNMQKIAKALKVEVAELLED